jgi:hypothetical protein
MNHRNRAVTPAGMIPSSACLLSVGDFLVSSVIGGLGGPVDVAAEILKRMLSAGF